VHVATTTSDNPSAAPLGLATVKSGIRSLAPLHVATENTENSSASSQGIGLPSIVEFQEDVISEISFSVFLFKIKIVVFRFSAGPTFLFIDWCCGSRHFDTDPYPAVHFDADPDLAFQFDPDLTAG
jgi:hypothetical protein